MSERIDELNRRYQEADERMRTAVMLVVRYGGIDGEQHKAWVLDQIVRVLLGNEGRDRVAQAAKAKGYEWDEGVAP